MILNERYQKLLTDLINYEIKNFLCEAVPRYQSFNNMHIKHENEETIRIVKNNVLLYAYALTNQALSIDKCWFNVLKEDSDYKYHSHDTLTAVYFLNGCNNNGTLISDGINVHQMPGENDSIQFIGSGVLHSVPKWSGVNRYSIAFQLRGPTQ